MTTSINPNGLAKRKQLSDQLDRLDGIIDALADNLNEAVAQAAREATQAAVQQVFVALLTDPATQALVREATGPTGPPAPAAGSSTPAHRPLVARFRAAVGQVVQRFAAAAARAASRVTMSAKAVLRRASTEVTGAAGQIAARARRVAAVLGKSVTAVVANPAVRMTVIVTLTVGMALLIRASRPAIVTALTAATAAALVGLRTYVWRAYHWVAVRLGSIGGIGWGAKKHE
jgi:hypothetical protein